MKKAVSTNDFLDIAAAGADTASERTGIDAEEVDSPTKKNQ